MHTVNFDAIYITLTRLQLMKGERDKDNCFQCTHCSDVFTAILSAFYPSHRTNLDSLLKSRDITLPTKVHMVKAMVFPLVRMNVRVGL